MKAFIPEQLSEQRRIAKGTGEIMSDKKAVTLYKCWFCGREYRTEEEADRCHNAGYYPIFRDGTKRKRSPFGN
jgi:DNA-directed RNA polymerase subunit RPC12/RpoP